MMKLYRIDWEWDEYLGAGEYNTHTNYEYVLGDRMLGKAVYEGMKDDNCPVRVSRLNFSLKGFWICAHRKWSSVKNLTTK